MDWWYLKEHNDNGVLVVIPREPHLTHHNLCMVSSLHSNAAAMPAIPGLQQLTKTKVESKINLWIPV